MDVLIGNQDNWISIDKKVTDEICFYLGREAYETGGIVGADTTGKITAFQFDAHALRAEIEYWPDIAFLSNVINNVWPKAGISFAGMVHSHPDNSKISSQDLSYAREIIKINNWSKLLIGIVDLSNISDDISWYFVEIDSVKKCNVRNN